MLPRGKPKDNGRRDPVSKPCCDLAQEPRSPTPHGHPPFTLTAVLITRPGLPWESHAGFGYTPSRKFTLVSNQLL